MGGRVSSRAGGLHPVISMQPMLAQGGGVQPLGDFSWCRWFARTRALPWWVPLHGELIIDQSSGNRYSGARIKRERGFGEHPAVSRPEDHEVWKRNLGDEMRDGRASVPRAEREVPGWECG